MLRAGCSCFGTNSSNGRTGKATNSSAPVDSLYYQTGQGVKTLKEKKETASEKGKDVYKSAEEGGGR